MDIKNNSQNYGPKNLVASSSKSAKKGLGQTVQRFGEKANLLLIWSIVLLVIAAALWLGLWLYEQNLSQEEERLADSLQELKAQRDADLEKEFAGLKKRIDILKILLGNRTYPSRLFKMLEELTLAQVQFLDFSADLSLAEISLGVETTGYAALAKQVSVFEKDQRIKKVELGGVDLRGSGRVGSILDLELDQSFLRAKQ